MYIFLSLLCLLSFVIFGYLVNIRVNGKYHFNYWILSLVPISLYCVTYGFRYGWGKDYLSYKSLYENGNIGGYRVIEDYEILFQGINYLLNSAHFQFYYAFLIYSFFLIFGVIFLLKNHRNIVIIALPIFYFLTAYQAANLIRYSIALGFVYMSLSYISQGNLRKFFISWFFAFLTHSSVIFILPFILLLNYVDLFKKLWVPIVLYAFSFFFDPALIGQYLLKLLDFSEARLNSNKLFTLSSYFLDKKIERYLSGDTLISSFEDIRLIQRYISVLINIMIIYYGFQVKRYRRYKHFGLFYNLAVVGIIFYGPLYGFEIPMRLNFFFWWLAFMVIPYLFKYLADSGSKISLTLFFVLLLLSYDYGPHSVVRVYKLPANYIWDISFK